MSSLFSELRRKNRKVKSRVAQDKAEEMGFSKQALFWKLTPILAYIAGSHQQFTALRQGGRAGQKAVAQEQICNWEEVETPGSRGTDDAFMQEHDLDNPSGVEQGVVSSTERNRPDICASYWPPPAAAVKKERKRWSNKGTLNSVPA